MVAVWVVQMEVAGMEAAMQEAAEAVGGAMAVATRVKGSVVAGSAAAYQEDMMADGMVAMEEDPKAEAASGEAVRVAGDVARAMMAVVDLAEAMLVVAVEAAATAEDLREGG